MMRVWSHRPQPVHLGLFFAAYVLGGAFATALGITPGTNISIWPPGGLFIATLILSSPYSWPWWILVGCPAELLGQFLWWHSPLHAAVLMYTGNALAAAVGAWLVNRVCRRPVRLETLPEVLAFVVLAAGIAPVVSATVGSATLAWFGIKSQSFAAAWPLWWIGDATGILIVAPLALVVLQNWRGEAQLSVARWMEAGVLALILLAVAAFSLSGYLPFAYLVMPPLLWAAVRFEFKGAVVTLALLALVTAAFTISGGSQFAGDPEAQRQKHIVLQLFLGISALSALIVAAISRQHQLALFTLRQSERRLQQLIETVPALIWSTTHDGTPTYVNKRLMDAVGVNLEGLIAPDGSRSLADVHPDDRPAVEQALARSFETGDAFAMTYRQRRSDGAYRWTEGRAEALRDESGGVVQWYGVCVDVDDLVTAQEALRSRERELSQLIDMVPIQIARMTSMGEPAFFNKRATDFFGLDVSETEKPGVSRLAAAIQTLVHPDDAAGFGQVVNHSLATGQRYSMKYRLRRADGVFRWMEGRAEPLRDQDGAIVQWYAVSIDIDDEVRAEQALRDRERELSQLVDMVPSYLWRLTPEGEPSFYNKPLIDYFGVDVANADKPGMSRLAAIIKAAVHPDDAASLGETLNRSLVTGERFSMKYRLRRADGVYRWMSGRAEPLRDEGGRILQWYGLAHDIDDQIQAEEALRVLAVTAMRAEEALRQRERELSLLVDMVPSQVWRLAPDGEPTFYNKRLVDFLGLDVMDVGKPGLSRLAAAIATLVHPDDAASLGEALSHSLATGEPFSMRFRQRRSDGAFRWVEARAEPLRDDSGVILQWYGANVDVDDLVTAQEALRAREQELSQLVDMVPSLLWRLAPDGTPVFFSKRMIDYLGLDVGVYNKPGMSGLAAAIAALVHPDDKARVGDALNRSLNTGESFSMRYRLRRADGAYRWMSGRAEPLRDQDGRIVQWYGLAHDIDDQMHAEEALRRAQDKLARATQAASLGELAASIAHEVNQPLAAIVATSHACQRWLSADPPNLKRAKITVDRIIRDANSASEVVSRIRALFSQMGKARSPADITEVIREVCRLMADELVRKNIKVETDLDRSLPAALIDRAQMQQVLVNLIRNAIDALDTTVDGKRVISLRAVSDGDHAIRVEVRDLGAGMKAPERVFEPFFTTKENGMGMGLAICRSIIESHNGRLWAVSNEPRGTTLVFTLPVQARDAT